MGFLGILIFLTLLYLIVYGIAKICATITVFFRIAWAVVIIACGVIVIRGGNISWMNYLVAGLSIYLLIVTLATQLRFVAQKSSKTADKNKFEYRQELRDIYTCIFTFMVFAPLYANLNYLLFVLPGSISFDEYKESGMALGIILSNAGIGPVKWLVLALAVVAFVQTYKRLGDFKASFRMAQAAQQAAMASKSSIGSYYTAVMGLPISPTENTVEANQRSLSEYFLPLLQNNEEKAEKLAKATLNIAAIEITDPGEILEALKEDSGLLEEEIKKCFPKLKSGERKNDT